MYVRVIQIKTQQTDLWRRIGVEKVARSKREALEERAEARKTLGTTGEDRGSRGGGRADMLRWA